MTQNEQYDGPDAAPCSFCGETFSTDADKCLAAAHTRIKELASQLAARDAEVGRLRERIAGQKELIKTTPAAALAAIAKCINAPLPCGHGLDCWDDSVKGKEHCVWCALVVKDAALATAREAGARAFAEWLDTSVQTYSFENYVHVLARFLASTGTALAEAEGEEGGE